MWIEQLSSVSLILLTLCIMLFSGFLLTRVTKKLRLPNVTGYILAGVLIGPSVFNIIPKQMISNMGFISDIALTFIAFSVGRFFKKEKLKKTGPEVLVITLFESLFAGIVVTIVMFFVFRLSFAFSLLLGAIATATAPASTIVTIRQYGARGKFVNTLLQVVALDDAVCLIVFSIATALVGHEGGQVASIQSILLTVLYNVLSVGLGFLCGFILSRLMTPDRSEDNRLILTLALLLGIAGLCAIVHVSPLLACMAFGMGYINLTKDKVLYEQVEKFSPPILSLFFIVSGMNLDLTSFTTYGLIGLTYFFVRILGKYFGAFLGCAVTGTSHKIRNYLGFALVPQAGVAIGLAFLGQRLLPEDSGMMLLSIILSSSVLYELVGPASAKFALHRSGAIAKGQKKKRKKENT